jgi:hypothetical protein
MGSGMLGKARKSATAAAALPKVNPLSFARSAHRYPLDKRREPHHFYRMAFGNYKIKADFGGQRITDRNSATA